MLDAGVDLWLWGVGGGGVLRCLCGDWRDISDHVWFVPGCGVFDDSP